MEKELICPKCGCDDINGIIYDADNYGEEIIQKLYGRCSQCGTLMYWKMRYGFIGYESIETKENR
jgi:hypothetical protein